MTRIISVYNQKGGVGKTTTVINLAAALAETGLVKKKVLIVDLDPQANATSGLGLKWEDFESNIYTALIAGQGAKEALVKAEKKLWILPSTPDLTGFEIEAVDLADRNQRLASLLEDIKEDFDYIFIDCPPSMGLLSLNALTASDSVIIPIQTEYYALQGVSQLVSTLNLVRESVNPNLEVEGILLTMADTRTNLSQDVMAEVNRYFQGQVFSTVIPRNVRLAEAPSYGASIIQYDKKSKGGQAYIQLAKELKKKHA